MAKRKDFLSAVMLHSTQLIALIEAHKLTDSFCASQIFLLNKFVRGVNKVHQVYWVREKQRPHIRRVSIRSIYHYIPLLKEKANSFKCVLPSSRVQVKPPSVIQLLNENKLISILLSRGHNDGRIGYSFFIDHLP